MLVNVEPLGDAIAHRHVLVGAMRRSDGTADVITRRPIEDPRRGNQQGHKAL